MKSAAILAGAAVVDNDGFACVEVRAANGDVGFVNGDDFAVDAG